MYKETIDQFVVLAQHKLHVLSAKPAAFAVSAMMAGAYIGLGIILIFSVAGTIEPAWQKLIMGASFGIALTLVVFAGAELFTGHTMYLTFAKLNGSASWGDVLGVWSMSWLFNFLGAAGLALIFVTGGGGVLLHEGSELLNQVAAYKMNSSALALVARATLCNWLVCLALWMSVRTQSDATKAIVIFWCLFAFIASGYEHSVANMTLLAIALLGDHPESVSLVGMAHNLTWVTLGNILGGSVFMGLGYWVADRGRILSRRSIVVNSPKS